MLNDIYKSFDQIVDHHDVYKVPAPALRLWPLRGPRPPEPDTVAPVITPVLSSRYSYNKRQVKNASYSTCIEL
jgi:hypothetical protein